MKTVYGDLSLSSAPAQEPLTIPQARDHLRITITDDDEYIGTLINVARHTAESITKRALITQTWVYYLPGFPDMDYIKLPRPPLQSVTSVKYTDSDGDQSTMSSSEYHVTTVSEPGRIELGYNESWPTDTLRPSEDAVEITYVAGYGDNPTDVPDEILHAMKILISDMYENRESTVVGTVVVPTKVPATALALLKMYEIHEW